jgi:hypothetical protein
LDRSRSGHGTERWRFFTRDHDCAQKKSGGPSVAALQAIKDERSPPIQIKSDKSGECALAGPSQLGSLSGEMTTLRLNRFFLSSA